MRLFSEGGVTKLRRELKLVLDATEASSLWANLSVAPDGRPPPTFVTSVYFDRPGFPLAARALRTPNDCLKVRTKEYSPDLGAAGVERVVLEVKREHNGITHKRRVWAPRAQLGGAIRRGGSLLPLIAGGSLMPALAVTYWRHIYQITDSCRVTVDRDISFYPVTAGLALSARPLSAERLGAPIYTGEHVVLEVKYLGNAPPGWVAALNPRGGIAYSKFAVGMARLHPGAVNRSVGR